MNIDSREAVHGKKMIEIKLRFWTDDIADDKGKIIAKHCWDSGVVRVTRNDLHGIEPLKPRLFNSLPEVLPTIEKVLRDHDIKLHLGRKSDKYYSTS